MSAKHTSYSAITTFTNCGEQYRLQKVHHAPEVPAWWSWGGTAFHASCDTIDYADFFGEDRPEDLVALFGNKLDLAVADEKRKVKEGVPPRMSKGQGEDWWRANGPKMVESYVAWRDSEQGQRLQLLTLDNGQPAIELEVKQEIGGLPILAFIDRVWVADTGEALIEDHKTSSREPADSLQLGFYRVLIEKQLGITADWGAYFMGRKGVLSEWRGLQKYDEAYVARFVSNFRKAREIGAYVPNPTGTLCGVCGVAYACFAKGGPEAHLYLEDGSTELVVP